MKVARVPVLGIALLGLLVGVAPARADQILWSYNWSSSPGIIYSDTSNTTYISLTSQQLQTAAGDSDIVATNLRTYSDASPASPATFTNKAYALSLFLQDQQSGQSGTLTFTGVFNGTLSSLNSNIENTFTGATTQSLILGNNLYVASIGPYSPPGPGNSSNPGSISAFAQVSISSIVIQDVPEPGTLVLAVLTLPFAAAAYRRRRLLRAVA